MKKEDWLWWSDFREKKSSTVSGTEYNKIAELHAEYFNHRLIIPCKCSPKRIQGFIDDLNKKFTSEPKPKVR